jgi:hypothetical protein
MRELRAIKVVGRRKLPATPAECLRQAHVLEMELNQLNPYPRPRGFVFRAKTWDDYATWRKEQKNPRLW